MSDTMGHRQKVFALYRGDTFIDVGTLKELSPRLGMKESTIRYYISQAYQRKLSNRNGMYKNQVIAISFYEDEESEDEHYAN